MTEPKSVRPSWNLWLWPVLLLTTIVVASSRSKIAAPGVAHFDKLAHFAVFGLLASLLCRMGRGWRAAALALMAVSAFGGLDEWHQSSTPGRSVEVEDWVADTTGAALAVALYTGWSWYRRVLEWPLFHRKPRVENSAAVETVSPS
jgi:VanZ family protein